MAAGQHYILMADVIRSSAAPARRLMKGLRGLVEGANQEFGARILSPLTITLGDEFQGVVDSLAAAVRIVFWLEERKLEARPAFGLRYVVKRGRVDTPLNPERAHGMLGPGLSGARQRLQGLKKEKARFLIETGAPRQDEALNLALALHQEVYDSWAERDHRLISLFLALRDYKLVAARCRRHPSSVFRRQRTLRIKVYFQIRELAQCLTQLWTQPV
ncbi:MAG: hypothetical protein FJW34_12285 [Acidobacteria bacterium]|nr:hypothetical protein [Acidobacteriota bacterium]